MRFDDESFPWVSGSNRHPPSILAANLLRLAAAHALCGEPEPAPQAPQWASSSSNVAPTPPSARRPVLHLFSGHPHPEDFASHLNLHGFNCIGLDQAAGVNPDITDNAVLSSLLRNISDHKFSAVVMNPPSEAYSVVRHLDDEPSRPAALYLHHCLSRRRTCGHALPGGCAHAHQIPTGSSERCGHPRRVP